MLSCFLALYIDSAILCLFFLPGSTAVLPFGHCESVLNQPASVKVVFLTAALPSGGETLRTDKYNLMTEVQIRLEHWGIAQIKER